MNGCRFLRQHHGPWDNPIGARHFGGPSIPPPPPTPKIELPPPVNFSFEMPEFPTFDVEDAEKKKEAKRQAELQSVVGRRAQGRYGTIKNKGGAVGLDDENVPVSRPGLIGR